MADKKLKIAVLAGVAAVVILITLLLTTCSGGAAPEPTVPAQMQQTEATELQVTEAPTQAPTEAPTEPTEVTEPTEATEPEETEPEETKASGSSKPGGSSSGSSSSDKEDDKKEETFKAPAAGAKNNPYVEVLSDERTEISTVTVAKGKSVYYEIHGAAKMVMTLEASDVKVTIGDEVSQPDENGVIELEMGEENKPVTLKLTNSGDKKAAYQLRFAKPVVEEEAPQTLESIDEIVVELAEGDENGCCYIWKATKSGKLMLKPKTAGYLISATHGDVTVSNAGSEDGSLALDITAGTDLTLQVVAAADADGKYPKVSDVITGTILEAGTLENPIALKTLTPDPLELKGGTDYCRYYQWTVEMPGTFAIRIAGAEPETAVCGVTLNPALTAAAAEQTETAQLATSASVEVEAGEQVLIRVETAPDENGTYSAAKITFACTFTAKPGLEVNPIVLDVPEDTLTVPAGESVYCTAQAPGKEMILTGENATVRVGETEYTPEAGKITIACGEESVLLIVTNNGTEEATYAVTFVDPDGEEPGETEPEVTEPEMTEPEVTEPEMTEPEATEPEETEPEETEPEVTEPEVTEPEVTEPEVTEPEVTEPEVTEPEVTEPEVTELEVSEPKATEPEVTEPVATEVQEISSKVPQEP